MLLDERNDVIHLLLRRLEAALSVLRDDELVATYPSALAVSTHIRRITQAIPLVQMITCVHQHFLYAQPVQKVIVCLAVLLSFVVNVVVYRATVPESFAFGLISSSNLRSNMIGFCLKVPCRNLLW